MCWFVEVGSDTLVQVSRVRLPHPGVRGPALILVDVPLTATDHSQCNGPCRPCGKPSRWRQAHTTPVQCTAKRGSLSCYRCIDRFVATITPRRSPTRLRCVTTAGPRALCAIEAAMFKPPAQTTPPKQQPVLTPAPGWPKG